MTLHMDNLAPSHVIKLDEERAELYFATKGFFTPEAMEAFLKEMVGTAMPLIDRGRTVDVIGDLTEFVPQDRPTSGSIRNSLLEGAGNGLGKFAVVSSSPLVRMQYRRITEGVNVEFFDDVASARRWIRGS